MHSKRLLCVLIFFCIISTSIFAQNKIQLKIASIAPSRSPWDIELRLLAQEWSKITGGQVQVTFYDTNSLGGEKSVIQKLRSVRPGQKAPLDGAIFTTIGLHELAPLASVYTLSLPFLIQNQKELDLVLDTLGNKLTKPMKEAGFELIAWTNVGWLSFYTKDPFSNLDELKKIKIASAGLDSPILGDTFRTIGLTIEDIHGSKLLQALKSNGGVRGFFGVHMFAYVTGLSKTIHYALDTKLSPVMAGFLLSNEAWEQIPEQHKVSMMKAVQEMKVRLNAALEETELSYMNKMTQEGVIAIRPTAAETNQWKADFAREFILVTKTVPGVFNIELYNDIRKLLESGKK